MRDTFPVRPVDGPQRELAEKIFKLSHGTMVPKDHEEEIQTWIAEMAATHLFTPPTTIRERWSQRDDFESYMGTFETYSDFMALDPRDQVLISKAIAAAIRRNGGLWNARFETVAIHGRKVTGVSR